MTVDGVDIFVAHLIVVNPTVSVTGYKLTQAGATQALSVAISVNAAGDTFNAYLVGNELDDLALANFQGTNVSNLAWDAESAHLSGNLTSPPGSVRIVADGTTIGTLSIVVPNGGNDQVDQD